MAAVKEMAARAGVEMVLDAAHGFGTETGLRRSPANARMAAYSMHATKVLVAGEGGLIATADDPMAEEARRLRNHGLAPDLLMSGPGFNAKMTELEALVALRSLDRLERSLRLRREAFDRLRRFLLESCDGMFAVQRVPEGVRSNAQNLAVRCLRPVSGGVDGMIETLRGEGIEARRYFWPPLHKMRAFAGGRPLPRTDEAVESLFCLPINSRMGPDTLEGMERALTRSVRRHDAG
jgi:dTDP-4-amino-4,6-dideoxygalactose transaminase